MERERPALVVGEVGHPLLRPVRMLFPQPRRIREGHALGAQDIVGLEDVLHPEVEHLGLLAPAGLTEDKADTPHVEEGRPWDRQKLRKSQPIPKEVTRPVERLHGAEDMIVRGQPIQFLSPFRLVDVIVTNTASDSGNTFN